ncbi:hypothetical protein KGA66_06120 [Actinocrinis puniceicyclus]|uniref:Uncharacterized protein n=1 Tax=Actinocrinis puniceicyclus TaxID=977794 RepID=A0A8J7WKM4_9ACTN|nr:hypothetical protein [Actinocrinis puniceicyclus]MBS2962615.1 hypothetical protein [Actinocrinis puniceicyclus]
MKDPAIDLVKLNSRLPVGERNGLDALGAQVASHPTGKFALILMCDAVELTTKVDTNQRIAKLRILRVEALGRKDFAAGQQTLPEHIEVELTEAFRLDDSDGGDLE